ncbi:hypothetical protein [Rhizobium mongolense]
MSDEDILKFGLNTATLVIEDQMPLHMVLALIANHAPDSEEAESVTAMLEVRDIDSGRFDGGGWSIWFVRVRATTH